MHTSSLKHSTETLTQLQMEVFVLWENEHVKEGKV